MGKRTRESEANKGEFSGSRRDRGCMPCSQATMGGCAITNALGATNRIHRETGAAPARSPNLRATIQIAQIKSASVARPRFLIACEDLCRNGAALRRPQVFCLPAFARLTRREREVAQLPCEGRSNKEIAQNACLNLQTVKKHLHSVFRKLQVPSRTRLVALAA